MKNDAIVKKYRVQINVIMKESKTPRLEISRLLMEAARADERAKLYEMLGSIKPINPSKILQQVLEIRVKLKPFET